MASTSAFQSTPSVWRETWLKKPVETVFGHFNPLPPCGGRPVLSSLLPAVFAISIHSLRVEGDSPFLSYPSVFGISIHSLRVEGDR